MSALLRDRTEAARTLGRSIAGVAAGAAAYLTVSALAWSTFDQWRSATGVVGLVGAAGILAVGVALVHCSARLGRVFALTSATTVLAITAIVILAPIPLAYADNQLTVVSFLQPPARLLIAPALAIGPVVAFVRRTGPSEGVSARTP